MAVLETPVLFPKYANSLAATGERISLPENVIQYDYEAERALVIGRRARYAREEEALAYVLGYCNAKHFVAGKGSSHTNVTNFDGLSPFKRNNSLRLHSCSTYAGGNGGKGTNYRLNLNTLNEFRHALYGCIGRTRDALFNLVDALASEASARSFPELSFSPFFKASPVLAADAVSV